MNKDEIHHLVKEQQSLKDIDIDMNLIMIIKKYLKNMVWYSQVEM